MPAAVPDPEALPFREITEPGYASDFITLGIDQAPLPGGGVTLYGRCPRCLASITVPLPEHTVKTVVAEQNTPAPAPAAPPPAVNGHGSEIPIACTCTTCQHVGRPAEYPDGCGAYWLLVTTPEGT